MKRWRCTICGHIYDPAEGDPDTGVPAGTPFESLPESWVCPDCVPDTGVPAGTPFESLPESWVCPDCGATKQDFEEMAS